MPFPKGQNPNHPAAGATIKVGQVKNLRAGDVLDLKQRKLHKDRPVTLNGTAIALDQR